VISIREHGRKIASLALLAGAVAVLPACTSIRENRGYIVDSTLVNAIQPGLDNQRSVEATLGRPTFTSQYGDPIWYYVSSTTARKPFVRPHAASSKTCSAISAWSAHRVRAAARRAVRGADTPFLNRTGAAPYRAA